MRTLTDLRNTLTGKIYIYCKDPKTAKQFLIDAENEGYRFGKIKPTDNSPDDIIALEKHKQLSYVGFVGRVAFQCNGNGDGTLHRIDYEKYRSGADYYYYKSCTNPTTIKVDTQFYDVVEIVGDKAEQAADYIKLRLKDCKSDDEERQLFDLVETKYNTLVLTD